MEREERSGECRVIEFRKGQAQKDKAKHEAEVMLAVDQYISCVHINKSYEIHSKLKIAEAESRGHCDGDAANDAYKKLVPGWLGI